MLKFLGIQQPYSEPDVDCISSSNPNEPYVGFDLLTNGDGTSTSTVHQDARHHSVDWTQEDGEWIRPDIERQVHAQLEN